MTDASRLPSGPRERVSFVRKKAKDYLVTQLAGQITLSQFYRLLNLIEEKVEVYFEHLSADWLGAPRRRKPPACRSRWPSTVRPCAKPWPVFPCP